MNLNQTDRDFLTHIAAKLTDPAGCQCPGCRLKSGDLPQLTDEQIYRLQQKLIDTAAIVRALINRHPGPDWLTNVLIYQHLRKLAMHAYAFGCDNVVSDNTGATNDH